MDKFKQGDSVEVNMPNCQVTGKIVSVFPNYGWTGETKYSVHGKDFITIVSARNIKHEGRQAS